MSAALTPEIVADGVAAGGVQRSEGAKQAFGGGAIQAHVAFALFLWHTLKHTIQIGSRR